LVAIPHNAVPLRLEATAEAARRRLGLCVLFLLWALIWVLGHDYRGLFHDARLYSLQALAHLEPDSLTRDVFLSFGSQDQYTIFSSLYATAIKSFGLEPAAAALTLTLQLGFFLSAVLLARQVTSLRLTLLGGSILLAIPGKYGAYTIFTVIESFITPRLAAEALVLCSLAAACRGRTSLAFILTILAMLLHPVMAAAGLTALLCLYVALPRPRLAALLTGITLIAVVAISYLPLTGSFGRFDDIWFDLVHRRGPYLFLESWRRDDWGRTAVSLVTLAVGVFTLPESTPTARGARALALVALLTAISGLALTLIGCDWRRLVLLTQLQPWRWLWLATTISALLLPAIVASCWRNGDPGRTTALLLIAAWIFAADILALVTSAVVVISLTFSRRLTPREARLILWGACGLLAIAIALQVSSNLLFMNSFFTDPQIPLWIRQTMSFCSDGSAPLAIILLTVWLVSQPRGAAGLVAVGLAAAALCAALTPFAWGRWTKQQFPSSLQAQFAPWRALIPPGKDVFWSESASQTWVLLQRPSYLSVVQTAGVLFSRPAAVEMQRRAIALRSVVPAGAFLDLDGAGAGIGPTPAQLENACASGEFDFLVSEAVLDRTPLATLPKEVWHASGGLRLYRCSDRMKS